VTFDKPTPDSRKKSMLIARITIGSLLVIMIVLTWYKMGVPGVRQGFKESFTMFGSILPSMIPGFMLAGFIQLLLPSETISRWMGQESGFRGILIGTVAGAVTPGGPFTHFPIVATFLTKGAAVGAVCAYIASWALLGVNRILVWELPLLGPQIAFIRIASCIFVPPVVGILGQALYNRLHHG
jgi:uncharacterized membrane protein YraQ (UPF0718 family)